MPYEGKAILPRDVAAHCSVYWPGPELPKAVATVLGESSARMGAWNDNVDAEGNVKSRDCGPFQINIPASQIGQPQEFVLRTASLDPDVIEAVLSYNVQRAHMLYDTAWTRHGKPDTRRWQPWVAYWTGWATFPEWYVWARPWLDHWAQTGRYIQRAIVGCANYHLMIEGDMDSNQALLYAQEQQVRFGIEGTLGIVIPKKPAPWIGSIAWTAIPSKPSKPPADGIGPRPVPNDGT